MDLDPTTPPTKDVPADVNCHVSDRNLNKFRPNYN